MGADNPYGEHLFTSTFLHRQRHWIGWRTTVPLCAVLSAMRSRLPRTTTVTFPSRPLSSSRGDWISTTWPGTKTWCRGSTPTNSGRLKDACTTPICTGEDVYLAEGFKELLEKQAISVIHPDLANLGGIMETKKAIDLATQYGVASCIHNNNGPITLFAGAHAAAAGDQFLAMEYHQADVPHFLDRVKRTDRPNDPIIDKGYHHGAERPGSWPRAQHGCPQGESARRRTLRAYNAMGQRD